MAKFNPDMMFTPPISDADLPAVIPPVSPVTKISRQNLREAIEDVFWNLGGPDGMLTWVDQSTANRRIFYKDILPKLIPKEMIGKIGGNDGGPIKMVVEWAGEASPAAACLETLIKSAVENLGDDD